MGLFASIRVLAFYSENPSLSCAASKCLIAIGVFCRVGYRGGLDESRRAERSEFPK